MSNFLNGFLSFASKTNRVSGEREDEQREGVVGEKVSELALDKSDENLVELKNQWESKWLNSNIRKEIEEKQKENEKYWLGDHYTSSQKKTGIRQPVDNLIFETLETFLPVATRQLAEPNIVSSDEAGAKEFSKKVGDRIKDVADVVRLRLKMKKAVRFWAIYFLGVLKFGWSMDTNEIAIEAIRPQQLILDPDAITDECEYLGEYIGHYRTDTVSDLINRFNGKAVQIKDSVGKDGLGTKVRYVEWWTNEYVFWTLGSIVLGKAKNPHWNYDRPGEPVEAVNEAGELILIPGEMTPGLNHFTRPKVPFAFLSVFNLGKGPYDNTNLIEQVLPLQDIVNKRTRQIDKNADGTNGGAVVSGEHFNAEQAREVGEALRKGNTIRVPTGDVNRAYRRDVAPPLPEFVYQNLLDTRDQIRGIFGTTGLSAQGIKSEDTVRGKILVRGQDADRAALIIDHIEQLYDYVFNWIVQLMVVYYDEPRRVSRYQGSDTISSADFVHPIVVSVKEGSLIPKDRLTQRNEAVELWQAGAIDPLTLAERLEVPNPEEFVRRLILWKMSPVSLLQEGQQQQFQAQQQAPPGSQEMMEPQSQALLEQVPIQ